MARMHADEVDISAEQVHRLIASQFPQWSGLELSRVASAGTDNTIFRLGKDKCVRLPRIASAAAQIVKEHAWLPRLRPLPLLTPEPLGLGVPDAWFPFPWAVFDWIEGEPAPFASLADPHAAAEALGDFVVALQAIDVTDAPLAGPANHGRGLPLAARDARTREAIAALRGQVDVAAVTAVWDMALAAPAHAGLPMWVHGDLHEGNLLQRDGRLVGVIDFGLLGAGDPAVDLSPAWTWMSADVREAFRRRVGADDAAWVRGRGWALSIAVIALAYYIETNPALARMSRSTISAVLADR